MSSDVFFSALGAVCWMICHYFDRRNPYSSREAAFWAVWNSVCVLPLMLFSDRPLTMIVDGGFAGWFAYLAWKRRKPRHRKPSKVAGMVRDLGHRLVVTTS